MNISHGIFYNSSGAECMAWVRMDPVKEVTAEVMSVAAGFSTNADSSIRVNGSDWNHNMDQIQREEQKKKAVMGEEPGGRESMNNKFIQAVYAAVMDFLAEEKKGREKYEQDKE